MEEMGDSLQRINEKALESKANLFAAIKSDNTKLPTTKEEDARILYFHYMRLNRIFRAYEYKRGKFITNNQLNKIIQPHRAILSDALKSLGPIAYRKYDKKFIKFLLAEIDKPDGINFYIGIHLVSEDEYNNLSIIADKDKNIKEKRKAFNELIEIKNK